MVRAQSGRRGGVRPPRTLSTLVAERVRSGHQNGLRMPIVTSVMVRVGEIDGMVGLDMVIAGVRNGMMRSEAYFNNGGTTLLDALSTNPLRIEEPLMLITHLCCSGYFIDFSYGLS